MIHLNEYKGFLENLVFPETYYASSIADFVERRQSLKPTDLLKDTLFRIKCFPYSTYLEGSALVLIPNVRYHGCFLGAVGLEDVTRRMMVIVESYFHEQFHANINEKNISEGETVNIALIRYEKKSDIPFLMLLDNVNATRPKLKSKARPVPEYALSLA